MAVNDSKRAANNKWDATNMAYQTIKVRKELLETFKATCKERGDAVNTVLRMAMEDYIKKDARIMNDLETEQK